MPQEFARSERVAQTINRQMAMILRNQVNDPRVSTLTITDVEVTKDLRQAKIFVTSMKDDTVDVKDTMQAVEKASGFLRRALAQVIICATAQIFFSSTTTQYRKVLICRP